VDNRGCIQQDRDSTLLHDIFNALTSRLLALHDHHCQGTTKGRILVLWDLVTVVVRMGTMPIGVHASKEIRLQLKARIRTPTTMPTPLQLRQPSRIKFVLV
jgi:hypothetical protein